MKYAFQTHMSFINPAGKEMHVITKDDAPMAEAYDPTGAREITHALNLIAFMQEHLPVAYSIANKFYEDTIREQNPTLVTRVETTSKEE